MSQEPYVAGYIYMAVCYLIVKRVRCCSLVSDSPIPFRGLHSGCIRHCLVDRLVPPIYEAGLRHPLLWVSPLPLKSIFSFVFRGTPKPGYDILESGVGFLGTVVEEFHALLHQPLA